MSLRVHQSNRIERLATRLAEAARTPLSGPMDAETIVVPNRGMQRWLSLQLADELGIAANLDFQLPASFAWGVWKQVLDDVGEEADFSAEVLTWRIFDAIGELEKTETWRPLIQSLGNGEEELRRFELADLIAKTFDQYLVYRPEMLLSWEDAPPDPSSDSDTVWQRALWRRVAGDAKPRHRARLAAEFAQVQSAALTRVELPERLHVFAIPALAPVQFEVFRRVADTRDVHLYVVNPCRQYWRDILPDSTIARIAGDQDPADLHLEKGNPLLASMGRQGRDFVELLDLEEDPEAFEDPVSSSPPLLLHLLQSDILDLRTRDGKEGNCQPVEIAPDDRSIQVHVAHSPMREVEILHDRLLDLFDRHPELDPSHVRVMTPDIETYAPLIETVFGSAQDSRSIPWEIADRPPRAERSAIATFLSLLDLPEARFEASLVLSLLESPAVQARFGIDSADLPLLTRWIDDAAIRWGYDAHQRKTLELPSSEYNTWRFGLDRLLLGHAMAGQGKRLFDGILPCDDIEGAEVTLLAKLDRFTEALSTFATELLQARSPGEWSKFLIASPSRFLDEKAATEDFGTIESAIRNLQAQMSQAGYERKVGHAVVTARLRELLQVPAGAWAFLSGAVTFCTMVPMRNIPSPILCLLGMNDDAFPRTQRPPAFDLISRRPRPGDRVRREDDRYLFLETLLSARRTLYLSYVGRNIRNNTERPPSILVSELEETIEASARQEGKDACVRIVHPLQGFSPRYFRDDPELFSYASELQPVAVSAARRATDRPATNRFVDSSLPMPGPENQTIRLASLVAFFKNPARGFLRERLDIEIVGEEEAIADEEVFTLEPLAHSSLQTETVTRLLEESGNDNVREALRASGRLAHGIPGDLAGQELLQVAARLAGRLREILPATPPVSKTFDLKIAPPSRTGRQIPFRLLGVLPSITGEGIIEWSASKRSGRHLIRPWIHHLVLNRLAPRDVELRTRTVFRDSTLSFPPLDADPQRAQEKAEELLSMLLRIYRGGLRAPLPFFPDASHDHVQQPRKSFELYGRRSLAAQWDPWPGLAFRGVEEFKPKFTKLANAFFGPLLDASTRNSEDEA
jgi:exodeoxyribonuclease V gamma subunit